ncbi:MAG: hypothetical protein EKK59_01565 [Neisseriaceae bacterium]|nr:MAG: hypothetical protein EKK59_01565 [Neisseriaceae bacterium]
MAVLYVPVAMKFMPGLQSQSYAAGSLIIFGTGILVWRWPVALFAYWLGVLCGGSIAATFVGSTDTYSPTPGLLLMGIVTGIPFCLWLCFKVLAYVWKNG